VAHTRIRAAKARVLPCTATTTSSARSTLLLRQLDVEDAWHLAPVLTRCPRRRLAAGRAVASDELQGAVLLVVESGVTAIAATAAPGRRRVTVAIAAAGDLLVPPGDGEELAALTDATVTLLTQLAFRAVLERPAAAGELLERLADAVRDRQASLATFASVEHLTRVRDKLLQLARTHGRVTSCGVELDLPLTHQLIAETVGSARETVTGAIAELRREGFLIRDGRRYLLTVPPELLQAAG
jgi:CRP-like cAMP-binding protein